MMTVINMIVRALLVHINVVIVPQMLRQMILPPKSIDTAMSLAMRARVTRTINSVILPVSEQIAVTHESRFTCIFGARVGMMPLACCMPVKPT